MNNKCRPYAETLRRQTSGLLPVAGILLLLASLASCSTTSNIPDDDQLFVGLKKIVYTDYAPSDHATQTQEELEAALATQPNGALFGSS